MTVTTNEKIFVRVLTDMENDHNLQNTSDDCNPHCIFKEDYIATLTIWEGGHGLMSMDSDCLQAIVYAKMTDAPILVEMGRGPIFCSYDYPVFKAKNVQITKVPDMISYLRENSYNLDYNLSSKQCSECYALSNMVMSQMKPVLEYIWWLDNNNYDEISAKLYLKSMPFPFSQNYGRYRKRLAQTLMQILFPLEEDMQVIKHNLYSLTADTFSALAMRLRDSEYFFGSLPSSLDAVVYAYLSPLVYIPFPSCEVRNLLNAWPKLIEYVKRINSQIFTCLPSDEYYAKRTYIKCLQNLWRMKKPKLEWKKDTQTFKWSRFIMGLCITIISCRFTFLMVKLYSKK